MVSISETVDLIMASECTRPQLATLKNAFHWSQIIEHVDSLGQILSICQKKNNESFVVLHFF